MNGQNEHKADNSRRTPGWLIEAAHEVMGRIDLDPASDLNAQMTVQAHTCFGPGCVWEDGLSTHWFGRVWLNPPGGKLDPVTLQPKGPGPGLSSAAAWWTKLVQEYLSGHIEQALFLAFSLNVFRTGQTGPAAPYEFPFLVFRERIRFPGSDGSKGESPNVDSALVYLPPMSGTGDALNKFKAVFGQYGKVRI